MKEMAAFKPKSNSCKTLSMYSQWLSMLPVSLWPASTLESGVAVMLDRGAGEGTMGVTDTLSMSTRAEPESTPLGGGLEGPLVTTPSAGSFLSGDLHSTYAQL